MEKIGIIITGSNGFIGSRLIKKLNDQLNNFEYEKKKEFNSIHKEMKNV